MNIKLLKKVRRRFSYYRGPTGIWQIVDHELKCNQEIGESYVRSKYSDVPDTIDEKSIWQAAFNFMLEKILPDYHRRSDYNYTKRRAKRPFKVYPLRES